MKKDASRLKCDTSFSFADNCKSVRGDNDFRRRYLFDSTCFSCFSRKIVPITLKSKDVHTVRLDRFYFLTRQTFFTLSHFFLATACRQKMPTWWKKYFCRRICRQVQAIVNLAVFKSTKKWAEKLDSKGLTKFKRYGIIKKNIQANE